MALPVSLSGLSLAIVIAGPFRSSTGNFYLFGRDGTTATTLQIYKATDPTSAWASVTTNTGFATSIYSIRAYQQGDTIHLLISDGTSAAALNWKYRTFNMATDAIVLSETIVSAINVTDNAGNFYGNSAIVFRASDSQPICYVQKARVSTHGVTAYYRRTGVATWAAAVVVDPGVTTSDYYAQDMIIGASSTLHFTYSTAGSSISQRALTSANVLQTASVFATVAGTSQSQGVAVVIGANTLVAIGANSSASNNVAAGYFTSGNTPTLNQSADINSGAAGNSSCRVVMDDTDMWMLYVRSDDLDVRVARSRDGGATWIEGDTLAMSATYATSGPNASDGISINGQPYVSANGAGKVLPYVVNDAGTWKYNEFLLSNFIESRRAPVASFAAMRSSVL